MIQLNNKGTDPERINEAPLMNYQMVEEFNIFISNLG